MLRSSRPEMGSESLREQQRHQGPGRGVGGGGWNQTMSVLRGALETSYGSFQLGPGTAPGSPLGKGLADPSPLLWRY